MLEERPGRGQQAVHRLAALLLATASGAVLSSLCALAIAAPVHTHTRSRSGPAAIPQTGVLDAADLEAVAKLELDKSNDQFAADPAKKFVHRSFHFSIPFLDRANSDDSASTYWKYDANTQRLSFFLVPEPIGGVRVQLVNRRVRVGSFMGQTAMNVRFPVRLFRSFEIHLIDHATAPSAELDLSVPPETGRQLSKDVVLEVDGMLSDDLVTCNHEDDRATLDDPVEEQITACTIFVALKRLAFVKQSSGEVLKEIKIGSTPVS